MIERSSKNPIISPTNISPLSNKYKVIGTFNAGSTMYKDKFVLLVRVAEEVIQDDDKFFKAAIYNPDDNKINILKFNKNDKEIDFSDSRWLRKKDNLDVICLTSISHIRIAISEDGENFKVDENAFVYPENQYEAFGVEDPRITKIDDTYYINYTAVSQRGITTALASTKDFVHIEKHGIIFEPENRDVCIFPEKINNKYWALHRPMQRSIFPVCQCIAA